MKRRNLRLTVRIKLIVILIFLTSNLIYSQNSLSEISCDTLNINDVSAVVFSDGNFFMNEGNQHAYVVPNDSNSGTIFNMSLWLGGYDTNDSLHITAPRYHENKYLPGPISDISMLDDTATALNYNKVWKINRLQIDEFKTEWELGNVSNGSYTIPDIISSWPGNHPTLTSQLAPYVDSNQDGIYNPIDGDYPNILGDQMIWWVFNDNTTRPLENSKPLGIEVRASFYGYLYDNPTNDSLDIINKSTLIDFEIINQSNNNYDSSFLALWTDFNIGGPNDDYVGCHVDYNSFYGYNGSILDEFNLWGDTIPPPPSQSITLLKGPLADPNDGIDNDRDGTIDEYNELICLTNFFDHQQNKNDLKNNFGKDYYNYMQCKFNDSTHLLYPNIDSNLINIETDYCYPGDSDPLGWGQNGQVLPAWTESTLNNPPHNKACIGSSGPFTFNSGEVLNIKYALTYARADSLGPFSSVLENIENISNIINWYDNGNFPSSYTYGISESTPNNDFVIYPNPILDELFIKGLSGNETLTMTDLLGREIFFPDSVTSRDAVNKKIQLGHLPNGVYLLTIESEGHTRTFKVVKK